MPASDYPTLLASLSTRRAAQFEETVALLEGARAAGVIANAQYNNAKLPFSRAIEEAWKKVVEEPFFWNRDYCATETERTAIFAFSGAPAPHLMKGFNAKAAALGDTASGRAARAFLDEIAPAMALMAHAKTIAVKKVPKAPEAPLTEVYSAPAASGTAMALVNSALLEVTARAREHLATMIAERERSLLSRYLQAYAEHETEFPQKRRMSPHDYSRKVGDGKSEPHVRMPLDALTESVGYQGAYRQRPDAEEILARRGAEAADILCADFVNRNLQKLDSIVEAKGDFDRIEVIGQEMNPAGMEGRMRVSFADGSNFEARTSVVWSTSIYGKPFTRFPVTFHDVTGPEGDLGRKLSEQEMNEVFAAARPERDDDSPEP